MEFLHESFVGIYDSLVLQKFPETGNSSLIFSPLDFVRTRQFITFWWMFFFELLMEHFNEFPLSLPKTRTI
jgi:hypothetical protein